MRLQKIWSVMTGNPASLECIRRVLWDTTVRYNLDEDPRQIERHASSDKLNSRYSACALGGNGGNVLALASGRHLFFHATSEKTGKQLESVGAAHGSSGVAILSMAVCVVLHTYKHIYIHTCTQSFTRYVGIHDLASFWRESRVASVSIDLVLRTEARLSNLFFVKIAKWHHTRFFYPLPSFPNVCC